MFRCLLFGPHVIWCDYFPVPYWGTISCHLGSIRKKQQRREARLFFFFLMEKPLASTFWCDLACEAPASTWQNLWLQLQPMEGESPGMHALFCRKSLEKSICLVCFLLAVMSPCETKTLPWVKSASQQCAAWASVLLCLPLKAAVVWEFNNNHLLMKTPPQ